MTHQPRARFGTAAFVTGGLDPVRTRAEFHALFGPAPPSPDLALPAGLTDAVSLVSIAPRHSPMHTNPRVNHAAI